MWKKILIALAAVIVLFLVVVAVQPDSYSMERSALIDAPPEVLFAQVNDHRNFVKWNPFNELDPDVVNTFSGAESGVGAVCSWKGNSRIGAGSSTIIESKPYQVVRQRMDWKKPMEGTGTVAFTFEEQDDQTLVTWKMYGPQNFVCKAFSLFMSPEKMCGPVFEKGLVDLATIAKKSS